MCMVIGMYICTVYVTLCLFLICRHGLSPIACHEVVGDTPNTTKCVIFVLLL